MAIFTHNQVYEVVVSITMWAFFFLVLPSPVSPQAVVTSESLPVVVAAVLWVLLAADDVSDQVATVSIAYHQAEKRGIGDAIAGHSKGPILLHTRPNVTEGIWKIYQHIHILCTLPQNASIIFCGSLLPRVSCGLYLLRLYVPESCHSACPPKHRAIYSFSDWLEI